MNGQIIPEETEKSIEVKQENATFLVIGDKAYTSEIIEEYNRNAEAKTEDFNTNAENKTASYNSNAADRTTAFNNNYDNKIAAFDSNANTQTEEFDSHVLMQTNTFNNNATSTIANYNSNAEQKTYEFNQNALSYQEGIDANKKHIINVSNELERVKNDVLETGTDTDTYIHLEDSAMAEYQELSVDGVCKQETTSGKNLWNFNERTVVNASIDSSTLDTNKIYNSKTRNNINGNNRVTYTKENETITMKTTNSYNGLALPFDCVAGETYTISATISDNTKFSFEIGFFTDLTYVSEVSSWNENSYTFTIPENINKMLICITPTVSDLDITISNIQLELGSSATSYEPYTGGQSSPSPDYPQEMEVIDESFELISCGKNMIPFYEGTKTYNGRTYKFENGTLTINGISTEENAICLFNGERTAKYVSATTLTKTNSILFPAGTYKFSRVNVENGYSIGIKHGKLGTVGTDTYIGSEYNTGTFVLNEAEWVTLLIYDFTREEKQVIIKNFQIERNPTVTEYEPYQSTKAQITVPENEFVGKINDTYKDTLKVEYNEEDGQYHLNLYKGIRKVIFDGSENWNYQNNAFTILLNDIKITNSYEDRGTYLMISNYFLKGETNYRDAIQDLHIAKTIDLNGKQIGIKYSEITSVDDFKTWLSTHNTEVYYAIETPYILDLGVVDMPITYNEVTNLFADSDLMPTINAKYYRNFITTIQNLQVNEKALKQELVDINSRLSALESVQTSTIQEREVVE